MRIGISELVVIMIVAACFLRPERVTSFAKTLGKSFRVMKEAYKEASEEIRPVKEELNSFKNELDITDEDGHKTPSSR